VRRRRIEERTSEITETKSEKTKKLRFIFEVSIKIYLRDEEEASTSFSSFFWLESPVFNRYIQRTSSFFSLNHHRRLNGKNKR
jgi:hypothetical protein